MSKRLPDDWHPRDERDARIEELEEENERLRAERDDAIEMLKSCVHKARIDAALEIPGEVRKEMAHPLWPMLTEGDMLSKVEEMLVKALKGKP